MPASHGHTDVAQRDHLMALPSSQFERSRIYIDYVARILNYIILCRPYAYNVFLVKYTLRVTDHCQIEFSITKQVSKFTRMGCREFTREP